MKTSNINLPVLAEISTPKSTESMELVRDSDIPELETRFSNSWIVTRKDTGKAVLETHSRNTLKRFYRDKVNIQTCYQYLCRINREIREGSTLYNS